MTVVVSTPEGMYSDSHGVFTETWVYTYSKVKKLHMSKCGRFMYSFVGTTLSNGQITEVESILLKYLGISHLERKVGNLEGLGKALLLDFHPKNLVIHTLTERFLIKISLSACSGNRRTITSITNILPTDNIVTGNGASAANIALNVTHDPVRAIEHACLINFDCMLPVQQLLTKDLLPFEHKEYVDLGGEQ